MNSLSGKHVVGGSVSLRLAKKRWEDKTIFNYTMCIRGQGWTIKRLFKVHTTTTPELMVAITNRQDVTVQNVQNGTLPSLQL